MPLQWCTATCSSVRLALLRYRVYIIPDVALCQCLQESRVYEWVVGNQADEQVLDMNKGGVGTRFIASRPGGGTRVSMTPPVGRDKSGPYAPPTLVGLQRVHTPVYGCALTTLS